MHELNREIVSYLGKDYTIVDVLDNNLILVVNTEELKNEAFPLQPLIIPDPSVRV